MSDPTRPWFPKLRLALLASLLGAVTAWAQSRPVTPGTVRPVPPSGLLDASGRPGSGTDSSLPSRFTPKFEAWAETKLLMDGLARSNHRGVGRLLKARPPDVETWTFARGQALLLAETGNLLLLRPPRNTGRDTWMKLAMEMRDEAGALGQAAGERDYARSRAALDRVTAACNRCHTTFRVPVRVRGEGDEGERDVRHETPARPGLAD